IFALNHQEVEEVERRRLDRDHRFAGRGDGIGNVGEFEVVGTAVARTENGFHWRHLGQSKWDRAKMPVFMPDLPGCDKLKFAVQSESSGRRGFANRSAPVIAWRRSRWMMDHRRIERNAY